MSCLRRRKSREDDLEDEILAHLGIETKQRVERGETPDEAQFGARRGFGNIGVVKEVTRAAWRWHWLDCTLQDLHYALRALRKAPGFTAVAILILALGIGANTAIFNIVDAALLRPLSFADSDRLVRILCTKNGAPVGGPSAMDVRDYARAAHGFESMVVYDHWRKNVSGILGSQAPEEMVVGLVPGEYFRVLRIRPILGRLFTDAEAVYGRHYVAAISTSFWRTRFAGAPNVLGRTLRINDETYTIVAVMPDVIPRWVDETNAPVQIWTPFASPNMWTEAQRGARDDSTMARLKPGVSYDEARAELAAIAARLAREHPVDRGVGATIEPLADTRAGPLRPVLFMLCGAVGMVLLIASANLAGLLLARNSVRAREMAVRVALGAGRWRLLSQLFVETLVLTLGGALAGLALSTIAGPALISVNAAVNVPYASNTLAQFWSPAPDSRMLLFALGVSLFTAVLFGLAPAFTATRVRLADGLREGGRTGSAGVARQRFRRMLVTAEVALSLILLVAAALLTQTMIRLQRQNFGFPSSRLLLAHVYVPPARYPDPPSITRFCHQFAERVRSVPGVLDASITTGYPPLVRWQQMFTVPGLPTARTTDVPTARFIGADAHFLRTLGLTVVSGRDFGESDTPASAPVAVVNEAFVRRYFPGQNPIGRQIRPGPPPGVEPPAFGDFGASTQPITIIGVVRDFMNQGMMLPPAPQIFSLFRQYPGLNYGFKDIIVRTAVNPETVITEVARQLRMLDPEIPLGEVRTMEAHMSYQTADTRATTMLLGLFAVVGTILSVIGVYGVMSYLVTQRAHELGVRAALGANSAAILWLVLRQGVAIGIAGVGIGAAGALAARQVLARLLYGVSAQDPATLGGAALLLLAVILIATAAPARRAMRIDPVQALRSE